MDSSNAGLFVQIIFVLISFGLLVVAYKNQWLKSKKSKRPQILNEVQRVILPFIDVLERNIENLSKGYYGLTIFDDKVYINGVMSLIANFADFPFKDFSKKYSRLKGEIDCYNEEVGELEKKVGGLYGVLSTPEMKAVYTDKAKAFIDKKEGRTDLGDIDNIYRTIIPFIIYKSTDIEGWFKPFWDENKGFFLDFRNDESLKEYFNDLETFSQNLYDSSRYLKRALEKILDKYWSDYDITQEELKPHDWTDDLKIPGFDD